MNLEEIEFLDSETRLDNQRFNYIRTIMGQAKS